MNAQTFNIRVCSQLFWTILVAAWVPVVCVSAVQRKTATWDSGLRLKREQNSWVDWYFGIESVLRTELLIKAFGKSVHNWCLVYWMCVCIYLSFSRFRNKTLLLLYRLDSSSLALPFVYHTLETTLSILLFSPSAANSVILWKKWSRFKNKHLSFWRLFSYILFHFILKMKKICQLQLFVLWFQIFNQMDSIFSDIYIVLK